MKLLLFTSFLFLSVFLPKSGTAQHMTGIAADKGVTVAHFTTYPEHKDFLVLITDYGKKYKRLDTPYALTWNTPTLSLNGGTILAATYSDAVISSDTGSTWKDIELPQNPSYSAYIFGSNLFGSGKEGLFVSTNNGEKWKKCSGIKKADIYCMASFEKTLYAAGAEKDGTVPVIYISTDNGENWTKSMVGLVANPIRSLEVNSSSVLAYTHSWGQVKDVHIFDVAKQKWDPLIPESQCPTAHQITSMAIADTNYVVSTIEDYYLSSDKGKTWKMIKTDFAADEFKIGIKLIYNNGVLYTFTQKGRLFLSKDNGATWSKFQYQIDAENATVEAANKEKIKADKQKAYRDSVAAVTEFRQKNEKTLKNYFMGIGEMTYSNFDTAVVRFNAAIAAKPDFTEAYIAREKCFRSMNQAENAKKDSTASAQLKAEGKVNPLFTDHFKSVEAESNKVGSEMYTECYYKDAHGWYLRAKNDYSSDRQITYLWKAVELDDTKAEYYIALGDVSRDRFYDVAAETHYKKAMALNPKCEWYEYERMQMLTCGNCNGKGYRLQVNITQQKVNNTTHSTSDSERIPCTQCSQGYVKTYNKFPSVRLTK